MAKLPTTAKLAEMALESAVAPAQRRVLEGRSGSASDQASRSAQSFLVKGTGKLERAASPFAVETVIGEDDRKPITDTHLDPWRRICSLNLNPAMRLFGTGWFVGPRTIITAGHCVYSTLFFGSEGWVPEIQVSPGRDGRDFTPFGTFTVKRVAALEAWVRDGDPNFDIGVLHLDEPKGDETGWFGVGALDDSELRDRRVNVSGYPARRGGGIVQYFHANRILGLTDDRVFYDVDTGGGQSGSPVWVQDSPSDQPTVVAIHAYGTAGTPAAQLGLGEVNSAPRITPDVLDTIEGWVAADGGVASGPIHNP